MQMKMERVAYVHGWQWIYDVLTDFAPSLRKSPAWRCRCNSVTGTICFSHLLMTFLPLKAAYGLPFGWLGRSKRVGGWRVDARGPADFKAGRDVLEAWGVPKEAVVVRGFKAGEVFVCLRRDDVPRIRNILLLYASHPFSPNRLSADEVAEDDEGSTLKRKTDGTRNVLFSGFLDATNLPAFGAPLRYSLVLYQIDRTPAYPAKLEIRLEAAWGEHVDARHVVSACRAMGRFLWAICQAAGVEPVALPEGVVLPEGMRRRQRGCAFDVGDGRRRGSAVRDEDVRSAALLADSRGREEPGYPLLSRRNRVAGLCVALGRPLNPHALSRLLNDARVGAFERMPGTNSYRCSAGLLAASGAEGCGAQGDALPDVPGALRAASPGDVAAPAAEVVEAPAAVAPEAFPGEAGDEVPRSDAGRGTAFERAEEELRETDGDAEAMAGLPDKSEDEWAAEAAAMRRENELRRGPGLVGRAAQDEAWAGMSGGSTGQSGGPETQGGGDAANEVEAMLDEVLDEAEATKAKERKLEKKRAALEGVRMFNAADAALYLSVKEKEVVDALARGELKGVKVIGGSVRTRRMFFREELDEWIARRVAPQL